MAIAFTDVIGGGSVRAVTAKQTPAIDTAQSVASATTDLLSAPEADHLGHTESTNMLDTYVTVYDLTGPGEVNLLLCGADATNWAQDGWWQVTIDGYVWISAEILASTEAGGAKSLIGSLARNATDGVLHLSYCPVPFKTSFKVEVRAASVTGTTDGHTWIDYTLRA